MLYVLRRRFVRIRFSGFLANRRRKQLLPLCRQLLAGSAQPNSFMPSGADAEPCSNWRCSHCGIVGYFSYLGKRAGQTMIDLSKAKTCLGDIPSPRA